MARNRAVSGRRAGGPYIGFTPEKCQPEKRKFIHFCGRRAAGEFSHCFTNGQRLAGAALRP
jgi:hypothetical protein